MIAPAEYQFAMSTAINKAVALSRDDLIVQTARLFGFDRRGPDLTQEIERHSLIQDKIISATLGRTEIPQRSSLLPY
jgi:hypothetical protein